MEPDKAAKKIEQVKNKLVKELLFDKYFSKRIEQWNMRSYFNTAQP